MDTEPHTLPALFAQLGLDDSPRAVAQFIKTHQIFAADVPLHEASFWTEAQARFLKEAVLEDSDWAEVVDELNAQLHSH